MIDLTILKEYAKESKEIVEKRNKELEAEERGRSICRQKIYDWVFIIEKLKRALSYLEPIISISRSEPNIKFSTPHPLGGFNATLYHLRYETSSFFEYYINNDLVQECHFNDSISAQLRYFIKPEDYGTLDDVIMAYEEENSCPAIE